MSHASLQPSPHRGAIQEGRVALYTCLYTPPPSSKRILLEDPSYTFLSVDMGDACVCLIISWEISSGRAEQRRAPGPISQRQIYV
eukprot:4560349-Pleurochrysis_carterae.AAC.6